MSRWALPLPLLRRCDGSIVSGSRLRFNRGVVMKNESPDRQGWRVKPERGEEVGEEQKEEEEEEEVSIFDLTSFRIRILNRID